MLVIQHFGVVEIRTLDIGRDPLRNGKKFLDSCFAPLPLEAFVSLTKSLRDNTRHGFARRFRNDLSKAMGFGFFDV